MKRQLKLCTANQGVAQGMPAGRSAGPVTAVVPPIVSLSPAVSGLAASPIISVIPGVAVPPVVPIIPGQPQELHHSASSLLQSNAMCLMP